jgi:tyrosine-protein phosphatase YwqE
MFFLKQNILRTGLLEGMTDIHSHLLPGVDDGMQDKEGALDALLYMRSIGVRRIFLTPHVMSDLKENTPENLRAHFAQFAKLCPEGIELQLAAEYMLDAAFEQKIEAGLLTMPNRYVLVETSYLSPPPNLIDLLYEVSVSGYQPIIAHPERYMYMRERMYQQLKAKGYKFQLNLFSLVGTYGQTVRKKATAMLKEGLYDFTGSDIHQLRSYRESFAALSVSRSQRKEIERLLHNNTMLWG